MCREYYIKVTLFPILVTKMQRMINQCNTPQDSPELKKDM